MVEVVGEKTVPAYHGGLIAGVVYDEVVGDVLDITLTESRSWRGLGLKPHGIPSSFTQTSSARRAA